jgi:hypothetical protein
VTRSRLSKEKTNSSLFFCDHLSGERIERNPVLSGPLNEGVVFLNRTSIINRRVFLVFAFAICSLSFLSNPILALRFYFFVLLNSISHL